MNEYDKRKAIQKNWLVINLGDGTQLIHTDVSPSQISNKIDVALEEHLSPCVVSIDLFNYQSKQAVRLFDYCPF